MNVFIAGIHGVGKTYVASRLPASHGLLHTSASKLIREERALPEWNVDKRVSDVDANQIALVGAVARYNGQGTRLLLDGHFVLLDGQSQFVPLETAVFRSLNLGAVVLVEAEAAVIAERLKARDHLERDQAWLSRFMAKELEVAQKVCQELNLPLQVLRAPSDAEFADAIAAASSR